MKRPHPSTADDHPYDLAELLGPSASGFLAAPLEGDALAALALTAAQVERFNADGFVATNKPVLTSEQLAQLRRDMDALVDQAQPPEKLGLLHELHYNEAQGSGQVNRAIPALFEAPTIASVLRVCRVLLSRRSDGRLRITALHLSLPTSPLLCGQVLFHCLGHWRMFPSFHDLAFLDSVTLPASQLLQGRPVRFWHDQAFVKPAGDGAVVQWHQDYSCARTCACGTCMGVCMWHQDYSCAPTPTGTCPCSLACHLHPPFCSDSPSSQVKSNQVKPSQACWLCPSLPAWLGSCWGSWSPSLPFSPVGITLNPHPSPLTLHPSPSPSPLSLHPRPHSSPITHHPSPSPSPSPSPLSLCLCGSDLDLTGP